MFKTPAFKQVYILYNFENMLLGDLIPANTSLFPNVIPRFCLLACC